MMQHFTIQNQTAQSTAVQYNVSKFDNFDKSKKTFQQYKERFDIFLSIKGLTSDKNISKTIFLNSTGPEYFELLKLSAAPKEIGTLSFDEARTCPKVRQLSVGDRLQAKWYPTTGKPTWSLGTIMQKFGKLHDLVKLDGDGYSLKRHVNQLLRVTIDSQPKKRVMLALFLPSNIHLHDNNEQRRGPPVEFQQEPSENVNFGKKKPWEVVFLSQHRFGPKWTPARRSQYVSEKTTKRSMCCIYKKGLLPSARIMFGADSEQWWLQEDNDPKHRSRLCSETMTILGTDNQVLIAETLQDLQIFMNKLVDVSEECGISLNINKAKFMPGTKSTKNTVTSICITNQLKENKAKAVLFGAYYEKRKISNTPAYRAGKNNRKKINRKRKTLG
ncbi:hypothetical protein ILUMI_22748 [Ignelater luminosus]|uniref:Uncharacterized protein n=1 Tax=Ignelater luminosus TaxID=2038154 RepID=A0A8K0G2L6_IGNLU|nr:hypothetical protein ILUMI_22748 [Ignelater luminosus]